MQADPDLRRTVLVTTKVRALSGPCWQTDKMIRPSWPFHLLTSKAHPPHHHSSTRSSRSSARARTWRTFSARRSSRSSTRSCWVGPSSRACRAAAWAWARTRPSSPTRSSSRPARRWRSTTTRASSPASGACRPRPFSSAWASAASAASLRSAWRSATAGTWPRSCPCSRASCGPPR